MTAHRHLANIPAHTIILFPGSPTWRVVYAALGQYVENRHCDDPDDITEEEAATLHEATALLARFDAPLAELADLAEVKA